MYCNLLAIKNPSSIVTAMKFSLRVFIISFYCFFQAAHLLLAQDDEDEVVYELEEFVVTADTFYQVGDYSIISVDKIDEEEVQRLAQSTLGETLSWLPGVSSSFFGAGSSRPVIRGFEGFRVRMLQNDIGTLDVSDLSPDHGVTLEPLLIESIDIHRGPSALLYGNAAIGGAINSNSRLIPDEQTGSLATGAIETRFDSVSEGYATAAYTTLSWDDFAFQFTGSARDANDYDIPENARTDAYEQTFQPVVNNPDAGGVDPIENPSGTLPNTFHEGHSFSLGWAYIPEEKPFHAGVAYSRYSSEYGIPFQFSGDANDLFGDTSLELEQERFDLEASTEIDRMGISKIDFRLGYADYFHDEIFTGRAKDADKNFKDTRFDLHALEGRLDFYHNPLENLEGIVGVHGFKQDLSASFLAAPPLESSRFRNTFETDNIGFFVLETLTHEAWSFQMGGRFESQTIIDNSQAQFGFVDKVGGDSLSGSIGITWREFEKGGLDEIAVTVSTSYIERIPTVTERFAFWPNPAIQRFLIGGDIDLTPLSDEVSLGHELGIELRKDKLSSRLNVYYYNFDNFVFLQDIQGIGNLAEYVERQAEFYGWEAEANWELYADGLSELVLTLMSDFVHAQNETDNQPIPRIPPLRFGGRIVYENETLSAGLEFRHAQAQTRVQPESPVVRKELPTGSYNELNADFSYRFDFEKSELTCFIRLTNLLDEDRRIHTSFLKDVAPLPGRNVSAGIRWSF